MNDTQTPSTLKKFFILTRVQMLSAYDINKKIHTKGKRDLGRLYLMVILTIITEIFFGLFLFRSAMFYVEIGLGNFLLNITLIFATLFMIFTTLRATNGVLFGHKDHDMIMSLPVNSWIVVLSRVTKLYLVNLFIALSVFVPMIIGYIASGVATAQSLIIFIATIFFAPMFPMVAIIVIYTTITGLFAGFKYKNLINISTYLIFALLFIYFFSTMSFEDDAGVASVYATMAQALAQLYPPTILLQDNSFLGFGTFALLSVIVFYLYIAVTSKFFSKINTRVISYKQKESYIIKEQNQSTKFAALYKKEIKHIFSNTTYAINTIIGPLLMMVAVVAVLIIGLDGIIDFLDLDNLENINFNREQLLELGTHFIPVAIMLGLGMYNTTIVTISIEGKTLWILSSLPLKPKEIFNAKIATGLTFTLPFAIIASLVGSIIFNASPLDIFFIFAIPIAFSFFTTTLGIFMDVAYPVLDWANEYSLLKSFTTSGVIYMIAILAPAFILGFAMFHTISYFPEHVFTMQAIVLTIFVTITLVLYKLLLKKNLYE